jgi:hypothetical protein
VTGFAFTPDVVACLDVGSPKEGNVGWAILHGTGGGTGGDLHAFVNALAGHLVAGRTVAVGFECPLYVPKRADPAAMTNCRVGEKGLNWCGGPGASVLATGLAQVNWCLARIAEQAPGIQGTTRWDDLTDRRAHLYCWEAFITSRAGVEIALEDDNRIPLHEQDALCGALAFLRAIAHGGAPASDLGDEAAVSLVGLHLLETRLATDTSLLSEPCAVLKVRKPK